jgi:hypothetical protein
MMITVHGLSGVTLGRVRRLHAAKFFDTDTSAPQFADMVNEVVERFHMDSNWVGSTGIFEFDVPSSGLITLPLCLESILHAQLDDKPRPVMGNRYEFLQHGVGQIDPTTSGLGMLVDQGNVGIEVAFPSTAGILTLEHNSADAGKQVRILGPDENGDEIYDADGVPGELVTLSGTSTNTSNQFSNVLGIQKPRTGYPLVVKRSTTELANIPPGVENPVYRRYKVAKASALGESAYVRAVCTRQAVPVANEEDYVVPGNLSALKMGLYSITYEENNDLDRAAQYGAKAIDFLNKEAEKHRGGAQPLATFQPAGFGIGKTKALL